jgi:hypothetical protein
VLQVGGALTAEQNAQAKMVVDRIVAMLTKLGQRGYAQVEGKRRGEGSECWMRTLLLAVVCLLSSENTRSQGHIAFGNRNTTVGLDAPVYDVDGITKLEGSAYKAQLYWGVTPDSLAPFGPVLDFRTGAAAGYITSTVVVIPGTTAGTQIYVEMRAWADSQGSNWEAAAGTGHGYGRSNTITITPNVPMPPPPSMVGLESFALVPEPSSVVLFLLGAVTWFAGRVQLHCPQGQQIEPGNRRHASRYRSVSVI